MKVNYYYKNIWFFKKLAQQNGTKERSVIIILYLPYKFFHKIFLNNVNLLFKYKRKKFFFNCTSILNF